MEMKRLDYLFISRISLKLAIKILRAGWNTSVFTIPSLNIKKKSQTEIVSIAVSFALEFPFFLHMSAY